MCSTACRRSRSRASASPTRFDDAKAESRRKHPGLRDGRQPRHLPGRLDGLVAVLRAVAAGAHRLRHRSGRSGSFTTSRRTSRRPTTSRATNPEKLRAAAGPVVGRGGAQRRPAARLARDRAAERRGHGPAEPRRRPHELHLLSGPGRAAERRGAAHPEQVVDADRRRRGARGRRGRHDRHARRARRRLRALPARRQADLRLQLPRARALSRRRRGAAAGRQGAGAKWTSTTRARRRARQGGDGDRCR